MPTDDDQPDRYQGEERTEGVEDVLDELGNNTGDEEQSVEDVWAVVDDNPQPGENLGYEGQTLKFLRNNRRPHVVACCPYRESPQFAQNYIEINQNAVIADLTDWA